MDTIEKLEEALELLLRDGEELTEQVEAREREAQSRGKKRKREADISDEDFDKRLHKLVHAARCGGGMPRGDQYRLVHTPQVQPPPGTLLSPCLAKIFLQPP